MSEVYLSTAERLEEALERNADLEAKLAKHVAAVATVRERHKSEVNDYGLPAYCETCEYDPYPCPTIRAIDDALGADK